jgi:hypothetical protein
VANCHAHLQGNERVSIPVTRADSNGGMHALDGLSLEVVPKAEVAKHLEEGVMPLCDAHIFDVIRAHAFLRGGSAGHGARRLRGWGW